MAAIIFRFEEPDRALAALRSRGLRILSAEELLEKKSS